MNTMTTTPADELYDRLVAIAPPCPPAPRWANDHAAGWESASEGELWTSYERYMGMAGGYGGDGISVTVSKSLVYRESTGQLELQPGEALVGGKGGDIVVPGRDLRALAGLLVAAADLLDRIEVSPR